MLNHIEAKTNSKREKAYNIGRQIIFSIYTLNNITCEINSKGCEIERV